jgi:hypothetical protein
MSAALLMLTVCNALVAAVLLFASFAKLISPVILARSLMLLANRKALAAAVIVRAIGIVEAVVAIGLMFPASRLIASYILGSLGFAFISLGIVGKGRRIREPCGCFGVISGKPLGWSSVAFGALFILACITNGALSVESADTYMTAVPVISGLLICALCLITSTSILRRASA